MKKRFLFAGAMLVSLNFLSATAMAEHLAYQISDQDVEKLVLEMNKYEQCVYPEIAKAHNDPEKLKTFHSEKPEMEVWLWEVLLDELLTETIGKQNADKLRADDPSVQYFVKRLEQLNHSKPYLQPLTNNELARCDLIKKTINIINERKKQALKEPKK